MLRIVAATRHDQIGFMRHTLLGRTLARLMSRKEIRALVRYSNTGGLSEVFNAAIAEADITDTLIFTHDDVWMDDWFLPERLEEAFARYAVVGVAGNRRRLPRQPAWGFIDTIFTPDAPESLSGAVGHIRGVTEEMSWYGKTPAPVKMLDGIFLAASVRTLRSAGVTFDTRFAYHFYDLDFCRTCEKVGLGMGTWPITVTHGSFGRYGSPEWTQAYDAYLRKWGD
jgi:GT2 family glycosyltransferase